MLRMFFRLVRMQFRKIVVVSGMGGGLGTISAFGSNQAYATVIVEVRPSYLPDISDALTSRPRRRSSTGKSDVAARADWNTESPSSKCDSLFQSSSWSVLGLSPCDYKLTCIPSNSPELGKSRSAIASGFALETRLLRSDGKHDKGSTVGEVDGGQCVHEPLRLPRSV